MNKEQFSKLKVGDTVEYNDERLLKGCQFKITELLSGMAKGKVIKNGTGGSMINDYKVGTMIAGMFENLTLVSHNEATSEPFATLALSVQEAAVLFRLLRSVVGDSEKSVRKFANNVLDAISIKFPKTNCLDHVKMFEFNNYYVAANLSVEELGSKLVEIGLVKAPEKTKAPARHKLKGPDGKFAPKNYRRVMYPEHGNGTLVERHILLGDFIKGTSGTNVSVQEWDGKEWKPKTYSAAKIKPVK
jgi:hypothetical protein